LWPRAGREQTANRASRCSGGRLLRQNRNVRHRVARLPDGLTATWRVRGPVWAVWAVWVDPAVRARAARGLAVMPVLRVDLDQQRVKGAFDDPGHVAVGDLVRGQIAKLIELVASALVDGELQLEATRSKGGAGCALWQAAW